jgi:hypothetical protein
VSTHASSTDSALGTNADATRRSRCLLPGNVPMSAIGARLTGSRGGCSTAGLGWEAGIPHTVTDACRQRGRVPGLRIDRASIARQQDTPRHIWLRRAIVAAATDMSSVIGVGS